MLKDHIKNIHLGFIIIPVVLSIIGLFFVYSTGIRPESGDIGPFFQSQFFRQLIWVIVGLGLAVFIMTLDYYQLVEISEWFYIIGILLLVVTLIFGVRVRGAKSWLGFAGLGIQPSEIVKICYILFFAKYLSNAPEKEKDTEIFLYSLGIVAIPLGLIMLQPDLGTAIVYIVVFFIMFYIGRPRSAYTKYMLVTVLITVTVVLFSAYYKFYYVEMTGKTIDFLEILLSFKTLLIIAITMFLYSAVAIVINFFRPAEVIKKILPITLIAGIALVTAAVSLKVLKPYQWKRLLVFINPEFDHWGAGYNIIQSKIAIGSGGFFGKGLFRGTQNILGFLPEKSTDFIFSIICEELGFFGAGIIVILFVLYFYYIIRSIQNAKDKEGALIAAGVLAMFFTHFVINIGMTLGIAPATGLPLPFISYGGSSYLAFIVGAALAANIYSKRFVHK